MTAILTPLFTYRKCEFVRSFYPSSFLTFDKRLTPVFTEWRSCSQDRQFVDE